MSLATMLRAPHELLVTVTVAVDVEPCTTLPNETEAGVAEIVAVVPINCTTFGLPARY
jgi:hypothetical protein